MFASEPIMSGEVFLSDLLILIAAVLAGAVAVIRFRKDDDLGALLAAAVTLFFIGAFVL